MPELKTGKRGVRSYPLCIALCLLLALCLAFPSFGNATPIAAATATDAVVATDNVVTDNSVSVSAQQQALAQDYLQADAHIFAVFIQKASSQAGISSPNKTEQVTVATAGAAGPLVAGLAIAGFSASTALAANDLVETLTGTNPLQTALVGVTGSAAAAGGIQTALVIATMFTPSGGASKASRAASQVARHADDIVNVGGKLLGHADEVAGVARATGRAANTAEHLAGQAESVTQSSARINWPPNNGATPGSEKVITLESGTVVGRYGNESGRYVTKPGTNPKQLSLPPKTNTTDYHEYTVAKDIPNVQQAEVAPWFGQPGGGTQYLLPDSIKSLKNGGVLR